MRPSTLLLFLLGIDACLALLFCVMSYRQLVQIQNLAYTIQVLLSISYRALLSRIHTIESYYKHDILGVRHALAIV